MANVYVDSDGLVFKAAFAAEHSKVSDAECLNIFQGYLRKTVQDIYETITAIGDGGDTVIHFGLHAGGNYRKDVATLHEYKGNRKKMAMPRLLNDIRNSFINFVVIKGHGLERVTGRETDDWCGEMVTGPEDYIFSHDKDLLMIPGHHLRCDKKNVMSYQHVTEWEGDRAFYLSLLVGDTSDNIKGCPGIGAKKAGDILYPADKMDEDYLEMWYTDCKLAYYNYLKKEYVAKVESGETTHTGLMQLAEIMLEENAHLLWIQRSTQKYWHPPTGTGKVLQHPLMMKHISDSSIELPTF
jgi:hypothetical protein